MKVLSILLASSFTLAYYSAAYSFEIIKPAKSQYGYVGLKWQASSEEPAKVYILCPCNTEKKLLYLYFNRRLVRTVRDGERLIYKFSKEGLLQLTVELSIAYT